MPPVLASLPLLLCGPILRRVESTQVSVFVATKLPRQVKLLLYSYPAGLSGVPQAIGTSPAVETLALGVNLHAAVVTFRASPSLSEGRVYGYDINLIRPPGAPADPYLATDNLASLQLLSGNGALGYADGRLPTFSLAPADLNKLRFVHGSCRKPHAPGTDGLLAADAIIQGTRANAYARPHHLLLTGDQIYADDVAPALLNELTALGDLLLGWQPTEILPGVNQPAKNVKPGTRAQVLESRQTGFSSTASDCQLMSFGEYCAMYLFAWSPDVWPSEFATFSEVLPGDAAILAAGPPTREDPPEERRRWERARASEQAYERSTDAATLFGQGIYRVRRALANVPTLMIFDDHEITDDWYIDHDAKATTLGNPLGRRTITNGLAAYAVFQAWGNEPDYFDRFSGDQTKKGGELLEKIGQYRGAPGDVYNSLCALLGTSGGAAGVPAVRFDYELTFPSHKIIFLDARTRRGYPDGGEGAPDLLNLAPGATGKNELVRQVTDRLNTGVRLTILIAPAPVVGHPLVEWIQTRIGDHRDKDREVWRVDGRPALFEGLLQALVPFKRVVILSGDIHFGFSAQIRYFDDRQSPGRAAAFAQLNASAFGNEDTLTNKLGSFKSGATFGLVRDFLGWPAPGEHVADLPSPYATKLRVVGTPAVWQVQQGYSVELDPAPWRYRVQFCTDSRYAFDRRAPINPPPSVPPGARYLIRAQERALRQREIMLKDQMRTVIGRNNLGLVSFATDTAQEQWFTAFHQLWFVAKGDPSQTPRPYTTHSLSLTVPSADERPVLGSPPLDLARLQPWRRLISLRPSLAIQDELETQHQWEVHHIEKAWGPINLDFYPIRVSRLPPGMTAASVLDHLRTNLNSLVDNDVSTFNPYHDWARPQDSAIGDRWLTTSPLGAVVRIEMKALAQTVDTGSVVCAESFPDYWIFSTISTTLDWAHPVSGNRMFGYTDNGDGTYTFFTRGADRTTQFIDYASSGIVFSAADALWSSLQQGFYQEIVNLGGLAAMEPRTSERYDWARVSAAYHSPWIEWAQ